MGDHAALRPLVFDDADIGRFGEERVRLSFHVDRGETVSFQAPEKICNVLARTARGLELPFEGVVKLFGRQTRTFGSHELQTLAHRHIGVVPALPQIDYGLDLLDNTIFTAHSLGMRPRDIRPLAEGLLDGVGLSAKFHWRPERLTVGELRWAMLFRAVLPRPQLLVVENGALESDRLAGERMLTELSQFARSTRSAVFWVTQSTAMACFADRMYTYSQGGAVDVDSV